MDVSDCCTCLIAASIAVLHMLKSGSNAGSSNLRSSPEPQPIHNKAISAATTAGNRLKGMRRRAAKLLTCIQEQQHKYQPAEAANPLPPQQSELASLRQLVHNMQECSEQANEEGEALPPAHVVQSTYIPALLQ